MRWCSGMWTFKASCQRLGAHGASPPSIDRRTALKGAAGVGLLAAGGLGLFGAGCSGNKEDAGLQTVKVLSSQGNQVLTIQTLVTTMGYDKRFGLAPQNLAVASGTNILGPLLTGEADICIFAGFSQLIAAIEKGADLKIIGGASVKGQQALFAKNPAIQRVKDLEGKTVGVGAIGAQLHQVVSALLKKKNVDLGKVRFVNVGSSGDVFRAVVAGRVDAGNGQADVLSSLDEFGVHMIQDGDYAVELPEYTWQASFTSNATIKAKRELLVKTLAAYCNAYRYAQNPGSRDDYVQAQVIALTPKDHDEAVKRAVSQWNYLQSRKIYAEDLVLATDRVQYMQELNVQLGGQKRILPYDQLIDTSLAKEAVALLG
jgi:ABC-type nitrate/sulfonate/bicarbonate transport system substrate-binding protein